MSQLLAHLDLQLISSSAGAAHNDVITSFIKGITESYRVYLPRTILLDNSSEFPVASTRFEGFEVVKIMRSASIIHGHKIINNALKQEWICTCCGTPQNMNVSWSKT